MQRNVSDLVFRQQETAFLSDHIGDENGDIINKRIGVLDGMQLRVFQRDMIFQADHHIFEVQCKPEQKIRII